MRYRFVVCLCLLFVGVMACGPELWQPGDSGQCAPTNPNQTAWRESPLFAQTLADGAPGAPGCLRVQWGQAAHVETIAILMKPNGELLARAPDSNTYKEGPIGLPQAIRGQGPQFTILLFGEGFQATDQSSLDLCKNQMKQATYQCSQAPGRECWVQISLVVTNQSPARGSQDVAACRVDVNPKSQAEATDPEPPAPDAQPEPAPEPPSPDAIPEPPQDRKPEPPAPDAIPDLPVVDHSTTDGQKPDAVEPDHTPLKGPGARLA